MTDIVMPRLSDSMQEGTILSWLKAEGETVHVGEELLEIETDKSTVAHSADTDGVLEIIAPEGETIAVGEAIARLTPVDAPVVASSPGGGGTEPPQGWASRSTPLGASANGDSDDDGEAASEGHAAGNGNGHAASNGNGHAASDAVGSVTATPIARRMAATHDVDLSTLTGTGPLGRITRADVAARAGIADEPSPASAAPTPPASAAVPTPAPASAAVPTPAPGSTDGTLEPASRLQQLIARRMVQATSTVPHFQVETEVRMDAALALRAELRAAAQAASDTGTVEAVVPSLNDLIVKAAALALRAHPRANGSYTEDGFRLHAQINVGVAIAAQDALIVPRILDADEKSLGQIARESRQLAEKVRSGRIAPGDLEGATFTVSNLGMYGMTAITPVIDPPQAAILGVGATRPTLTRGPDGEIVERQLMTLRLSCDHRILYGADAARFLAEIRELLQTPLRLAL